MDERLRGLGIRGRQWQKSSPRRRKRERVWGRAAAAAVGFVSGGRGKRQDDEEGQSKVVGERNRQEGAEDLGWGNCELAEEPRQRAAGQYSSQTRALEQSAASGVGGGRQDFPVNMCLSTPRPFVVAAAECSPLLASAPCSQLAICHSRERHSGWSVGRSTFKQQHHHQGSTAQELGAWDERSPMISPIPARPAPVSLQVNSPNPRIESISNFPDPHASHACPFSLREIQSLLHLHVRSLTDPCHA